MTRSRAEMSPSAFLTKIVRAEEGDVTVRASVRMRILFDAGGEGVAPLRLKMTWKLAAIAATSVGAVGTALYHYRTSCSSVQAQNITEFPQLTLTRYMMDNSFVLQIVCLLKWCTKHFYLCG